MIINFEKSLWFSLAVFLLLAFISVKFSFLFLGLYFLFIAIKVKYKYTVLKTWQQVDGTIIEQKIMEDWRTLEVIGNRGYCNYTPYIKYSYEIGGEKIYSTDIALYKNDFITAYKKGLEKKLRKFKKDMHVTVYLDPAENKSLLFIEMSGRAKFYFYFNLLLGVALIVVGLFMSY